MEKLLLPLSLLIILLSLAFSEVRNQDFVHLDDDRNIYHNPYLSPVTASNIAHFWKHPYADTYRPLVYTSWALIGLAARSETAQQVPGTRELTTLRPSVFHSANLVLHILNAALVFAILCLLVEMPWAAFGGALLFGIHPVQVESVAWATGFNELLYAFSSLLCIYCYLRYVLCVPTQDSRKHAVFYALATLFFILALLTKPTAAALPFIAWCLAHWVLERPARRCTTDMMYWAVLCIPWIWVTHLFESAQNKAVPTALWTRPFLAADALTFYLGKLLAPFQLGIDYGRTPEWVLQQKWAYVIWLLPCAVLTAVWRSRKRAPWVAGAAGVFVAALLPVLGFVPFVFQAWSTVTDRYMYLALLGPALAAAVVLSQSKSRGVIAAFGCVLFLLGMKSSFQTLTWYSSYTLYRNAVEVNPSSVSAHNNLGRVFLNVGKTDEAAAQYAESLRLRPDSAEAHLNLGLVLFKQGKTARAIERYREALRLQPTYTPAQNALKGATR